MPSEDNHPHPEVIERFVLAKAGPADARAVTRHLLRECPQCRQVAQGILQRKGAALLMVGRMP